MLSRNFAPQAIDATRRIWLCMARAPELANLGGAEMKPIKITEGVRYFICSLFVWHGASSHITIAQSFVPPTNCVHSPLQELHEQCV